MGWKIQESTEKVLLQIAKVNGDIESVIVARYAENKIAATKEVVKEENVPQ